MERRLRRRGNGYPLSRDLAPQLVPVADCKPLGRETRKHPPQQVRKLAGEPRSVRIRSTDPDRCPSGGS